MIIENAKETSILYEYHTNEVPVWATATHMMNGKNGPNIGNLKIILYN